MKASGEVRPFVLRIPERDLSDLRERITRTRWPDDGVTTSWSQGVPSAEMRRLCSYWAGAYDWRRLESVLNDYGQFEVTIDGLNIHFLHIRSGHADARPLMLLHGWPGCVVEYLGVIDSLTGRAAADRQVFDLVIPSLPGFGFSGRPSDPGWGVDRIARVMAELMHRLGYGDYLLQGGDWGSVVATAMAAAPDTRCRAVHLTTLTIDAPKTVLGSDRAEAAQIARRRAQREQFAYAQLQATRPQTMGYALADSPVGQAAWIYEKLVAWTDHDGDVRSIVPDDTALDIISVYWFGNTAASSARLYAESFSEAGNSRRVRVPAAVSAFPADITGAPRRWAEEYFSRLDYWGTPARGGHFAALEQPKIFVDEVNRAFQSLL